MASAATQNGQVYLPVTKDDFGGMIMSLMQRQASLLAGADGVEVRIWHSSACSPLRLCSRLRALAQRNPALQA